MAVRNEWSGDLPKELRVPEFEAMWNLYMEYRRDELGKPVTPISGKLALNRCLEMGPVRAAAALEFSMANGWQGVFEPEVSRRGAPRTVPSLPRPKGGYCAHCSTDQVDLVLHKETCSERLRAYLGGSERARPVQ